MSNVEIKGYRELTVEEKEAINMIKTAEVVLLHLVKQLFATSTNDKRWLSIARTHFEEGFMAAVRGVAQPDTVDFN